MGIVFSVGACASAVAASALILLLGLFAIAARADAAPRVLAASFGSFGSPESLAVDQQSHAVYVLNRANGTVDRFDSSGTPLAFSAAQPYVSGNQLSGSGEGAFAFPSGNSEAEIAVAPPGSGAGTAGNLYVTDANGTVIDVFDDTGSYLGRLTEAGGAAFGYVCGVAVDPSGAVYVGDYNGAVHRFVPTADPPTNADFHSSLTGVTTPCNLAAGSGSVYASTWPSGPLTAYPLSLFPGGGGGFDASSSGTVIEDGGSPATANAAYVDPVSDDLYVDEGDRIAVFDGSGGLLEHFGAGEGFAGSRGVAVDAASGSAFVADSEDGTVGLFAAPVPGPPSVSALHVTAVTTTEARLEARVNPNSAATRYHFEYVDDVRFQASGFDAATRIPAPAAEIGEGFAGVPVARTVTALSPATKYHFRLSATNSFDTTESAERTFTTYAITGEQSCPNAVFRSGLSAALPNCRAYELVTPVVKDYGYAGLPGQPFSPTAIASLSGSSVVFNSGGPLPGAGAGPFENLYVASRDAGGWQSSSISPPQAPVATLGGVYPSFLAFRPDLSRAVVVSANPPLTPDAVPQAPNLYVQDLRPTAWSLLTPAGTEVTTGFVGYLGGSTDFGHHYYITTTPQNDEAPEEVGDTHSQVYGYVNGTLYLAGVLPDGTISPQAVAPRLTTSTVKEAHVGHVVSSDGTRVFFREGAFLTLASPLYLRVNADQPQGPPDLTGNCSETALACTVEVSASQKTNGAGPGGADPNGPKEAVFQEASEDASRTLFTSQSELTDDANTGRNGADESTDAGNDLYMYDLDSGELVDLTVDGNPADKATGANVLGLVGASEDASYVYFAATGDLAGGAVSGEPNLYLWHEGGVRFIGTLNPSTDGGNWAKDARDLTSRSTPDGTSLAFTSTAPITGYENEDSASGEPDSEVFLYRAASDSVTCVSCNPTGANPIGSSRISPGLGSAGNGFNPPRNLSDDGRRLFFDSRDALVPRDTNGRQDVYMFEGGGIYLISAGTGETDARFGSASPTGDDAFFGTEERLLPQDQDLLPDLYDARVNGGFAAGTSAVVCGGEDCRPPAGSGPPAQAPPGSSTFSGPGNKHLKHKKHHRKKHHRKKRGRGHHKRTGAGRGGSK